MKRSVNNQRELQRGWSSSPSTPVTPPPPPHASTSSSARAAAVLEAELRAAGMLLVRISETGDLLHLAARHEDWLSDLICHSQMGRALLYRAARAWSDQRSPQTIELVPGLVMVPMTVASRRRRTGYAVTCILTQRLVRSEHLAALCQSAGMDYQLVCSLLEQLPPAGEGDLGRLVLLVEKLHGAHRQLVEQERTIDQTSRQLAEGYEEISLLYTITQAMRVVQQPEKFVRMVCEELLGTLPYAWVGVLLRSGARSGGGREARGVGSDESCEVLPETWLFMTFGDPPDCGGGLRLLAEELLERVQPNVPMVLEPGVGGLGCDDERYGQLGRGALVHPVSTEGGGGEQVGQEQVGEQAGSNRPTGARPVGEGRVLGIIIAGEKLGDDASASSVDMKLLGATCNHMAIFLENAALYDDLNTMFLGSLEALTASIDAKDRYTCGHSRRVAHLTQLLARAIGMGATEVERMHIAGLVHDVGKIGVPERVLLKPGKLTDEEFGWIRRHPEMGYRILKDIPQLADVLPGVLYHHERWDGKGYPKGLKGEEIPLVARLIGLADAFDAMSSNRTYRSAMERGEVLEEIVKCAGTQFDPELVPHFVDLDFAEFDRLVDEHKAMDYVLLGER